MCPYFAPDRLAAIGLRALPGALLSEAVVTSPCSVGSARESGCDF